MSMWARIAFLGLRRGLRLAPPQAITFRAIGPKQCLPPASRLRLCPSSSLQSPAYSLLSPPLFCWVTFRHRYNAGMGATTTPRRRRFRFSLRTLFVVVTVLCVLLGREVNRVQEQRRAVEMIER